MPTRTRVSSAHVTLLREFVFGITSIEFAEVNGRVGTIL